MMFDEGPDDARGSFRTQSELPAAAVFEGVHFFLNHIGLRSQGTLKEFEGFKRRSADFLKSKTIKPMARVSFQALEQTGFGRKDIMGAANRLEFRTHGVKLYQTSF